MKNICVLLVLLILISCQKNEAIEQITNPKDYQDYLFKSNYSTKATALSEIEFWSKRLRPDSSGIGDLGPLANAYNSLFETTGNISYLKNAEKLLMKAITISAHDKDTYIRSISHVYSKQHRFLEAKELLEMSYKQVSNKHETELLLFDVYMELGEYNKADTMLGKVKNNYDFNYLIRLAKWNDHNGKLNAAIRNLENAKKIVDSRKSKQLQLWVYTNLADFYSHDGRLKESYNLYLKTLQLQSDNVYAKRKIAWIVYSYERNSKEANRILNSILAENNNPENYLFKAKIAAFEGNNSEFQKQQEKFIQCVSNEAYGAMYNLDLIELYFESQSLKALELAQEEVKNRATPETFIFLAYAHLKTGKKEKALAILTKFVENKSFSPKVWYYASLIYAANGMDKKAKEIESKLSDAAFEIGPLMIKNMK